MSTLWFCGDTHGSLLHLQRAWDRHGPVDAIIHLGDFDLARSLSDELSKDLAAVFWWIPGNHDFDQKSHHQYLFADPLASRCLHAQARRVADIRIAGLGGNFQGKVWRPPEPPQEAHPLKVRQRAGRASDAPSLKLLGAIWPDQVAQLSKQRASILVTHEAPSSHRNGFAAIDELAAKLGASLIVHGHHHEDYDATINGGRTRVMGVGFRGITDQHGRRIVPGSRGNRSAPLHHRPIASPSPAPTGGSP